jgi:hypothetical protein
MHNQMKTPQRRSTAPLPVPVTARGLPELREEAAKLNTELEVLHRIVIRGRLDELTDADVALVRRIGSEIDSVRAHWLIMTQPATDDQIFEEMTRLTTTMATSGNLNPNLLNETLCEDVEELKPTLFALVRACRAVRARYRFLNISDLMKELQEAERNARRYSYALEDFNLDEFNENLQAQIEHDEARALEWRAEQKRRKIAEHRQRKADRAEEMFWRRWVAGEDEIVVDEIDQDDDIDGENGDGASS